ncbi:hypothetical protein FNAPI_9376 [Fusarium napiforme]|uniref:Uncharacterized protein n=1 Tax=Fusarium napiforme TaxID=42672 RepID=A0A8H5IWD7_9HYPO|nr:hypothetical protein FNAPI_9376 [Fusarium napiforme]
MSHNSIDEATLKMLEEQGGKQRLEAVFQDDWHPGLPVPIPEKPIYKFSESALQVGHFKEDPPSRSPSLSPNRKRNAKAYLRVKRIGTRYPFTIFLWCDADGESVNKRYIQMAEGLVIQDLKRDLRIMYNKQEISIVTTFNEELKVMKDRLALRACALKEETYKLPADQRREDKEPVFCSEADFELN